MAHFFVYEEYGARYESILRDLASTSKNIPNWRLFEQGIEALSNTFSPMSSRQETSRKGLTFEDLLIKVSSPIERSLMLDLPHKKSNGKRDLCCD